MQDNLSRIAYTNEVIEKAKSRWTISKTKARLLKVLNYLWTNWIINVNLVNKGFNQVWLVNIAKWAKKQIWLVNFARKVKSQFSISPFSINRAKSADNQFSFSLHWWLNIADDVKNKQIWVSLLLPYLLPNINLAEKAWSQMNIWFGWLNMAKNIKEGQVWVWVLNMNYSIKADYQSVFSVFWVNDSVKYSKYQLVASLLWTNNWYEVKKQVGTWLYVDVVRKKTRWQEKWISSIIKTIKEIISKD